MTIKHLVISGGGPSMIQSLGTIQTLCELDYIHLKDIESIYGTSAGAIIGLILCLKYDFETLYDFIIKRPWHKIFSIQVQDIFDAYSKKGIFNIDTLEKCFKPLFEAKDLSVNMTLEQLYEYSKIELHLFVFEINEFKLEDISYLTHPQLSVLQAITMTCGLPILFTPICIDNKCYTDGGIVCNYPLKYCVESGKNVDEIFGLKNNFDNSNKSNITEDSNMLDYIMSFLFKVIHSLSIDHTQPTIKAELNLTSSSMNLNYFKNALQNVETRIELFQNGVETAKQFLSTLGS
jgi:predicted acylesterase/phospholipase RssA